VRFAAGADLFREGGAADQFYLIRHGRVALHVFFPGQ
jgi:CRP-like cAMP-binding protein